MVVGFGDAAKFTGIFIISCCAVFVCTLFLNFNMDMVGIRDEIAPGAVTVFYEAQVSSGRMISCVSGGCLLLTSVIMLFFYIKHYIDSHRKELGILKALGYSDFKIARGFWVFGVSVLLGTGIGFASSFLLMPTFYRVMNEDKILPDIAVHFHWSLLLFLVLIPAGFFSILAILYGCRKLGSPVLTLLRGKQGGIFKIRRQKRNSGKTLSFLQDLRQSTARSRISLLFFIGFASFCYSSMMQMTFGMKDLASAMFAVIIFVIGIVLSFTTLLLSVTTVVDANTKTIAMMRVFGYSQRDCRKAILDGYRPVAYGGFVVGTLYQFALIKSMVKIIYKDIPHVPDYTFNWQAFFIVLFSFILVYECIMLCYSVRIKNISLKEIMLE